MSPEELLAGELDAEVAKNQGTRWGFVSVSPNTSFVQHTHCGDRNLEEATAFVAGVKHKSVGNTPLAASDDWFYEKALLSSYGKWVTPVYKGRGRPPLPVLCPLPDLCYVQVVKTRDEKGRLIQKSTRIVYGTAEKIAEHYANATRSKHINTDYVESRNGKFRKDNSRLVRKTLCVSKKAIFHDAMIILLAQTYNYCQPVAALKRVINPTAARFEQKYEQISAAMAEGLIDKILTIKQLLFRRPQIRIDIQT